MIKHIKNISIALLFGLLTVISLHSFAQAPDTWTQKRAFGDTTSGTDALPRWGAVAFSIGNKGYMGTGGKSNTRLNDFWEYNPATNTWSQKAAFGTNDSLPAQSAPARMFASGFSIGTKGYVGCGDDDIQNGNDDHVSKDFYEYNPVTNRWKKKADFGGVPRRGAVGFSIGSKGYIGTGRYDGPDHFKDFWEYDPASDVWTRKADLVGNSRAFAAGFSIGSKGYIGTGRDDNAKVQDFWEYNPVTDSWTSKANFGGGNRYEAVGISIGAYGYIGLGEISATTLANDFWEYNPITNSWIQKAPFGGSPRICAAGFSIGNKGYIGTGLAFLDPRNPLIDYPNVNTNDFWEYTPAAIWNGTTDNNWELASNWLSSSVPDANTNVIIPANAANFPIISTVASCNNLTINKGAVLTIAASNSLTVTGTLVDSLNTGFVIKSNASGTGSLINSTTGVSATIERYLVGDWTAVNSGWHFISSPVANQAISVLTTSGANNGYDFYGWDEVSNLWMNYKASPGFGTWNGGTNFNTGQGYMVSYEATHTGSFSGNINVSNVTKSNLTRTSGGTNYTWHLLGNPFSSALKWNDGKWALTGVAGTAKSWNGTAKSYTDIPANGIIPMEQGFMISVSSPTNSITIPAASRIINSTAWYKSTDHNQIKLLASEEDGSSYQESNILINPSASAGFDFDYDSRFLPGYAPQFYSVSDNEMLSTNSLPTITDADVIPLSFVKNQSDNFKIELQESVEGHPVFLHDLKMDSIQNLNENPVYKFASTDSDDPSRFKLYFRDFSSARHETFSLYQSNGNIYIATLQTGDAEIRISNMLGQVVLRAKTNGNPLTTLNAATLQSGVYIVSFVGNNKKVVSKKIVVSKS